MLREQITEVVDRYVDADFPSARKAIIDELFALMSTQATEQEVLGDAEKGTVDSEVVIPKDIQLGDAGCVYQRRLYDECVTAGWDAAKRNTFAEEIAHLHEELSEAFRAWRLNKDFRIAYREDGKPEGIPIELADVLIGLFYNAELHGFDLFAAVEEKHQYNLTRNYQAEGRQLHYSERQTK